MGNQNEGCLSRERPSIAAQAYRPGASGGCEGAESAAVDHLLMSLLVIRIASQDLLELRARLILHPEHHHGHAQVVPGIVVIGVGVNDLLEGSNAAIKIALKAENQSVLPSSIGVVWIRGQHCLEVHLSFAVAAFAAGIKALLVEIVAHRRKETVPVIIPNLSRGCLVS